MASLFSFKLNDSSFLLNNIAWHHILMSWTKQTTLSIITKRMWQENFPIICKKNLWKPPSESMDNSSNLASEVNKIVHTYSDDTGRSIAKLNKKRKGWIKKLKNIFHLLNKWGKGSNSFILPFTWIQTHENEKSTNLWLFQHVNSIIPIYFSIFIKPEYLLVNFDYNPYTENFDYRSTNLWIFIKFKEQG